MKARRRGSLIKTMLHQLLQPRSSLADQATAAETYAKKRHEELEHARRLYKARKQAARDSRELRSLSRSRTTMLLAGLIALVLIVVVIVTSRGC